MSVCWSVFPVLDRWLLDWFYMGPLVWINQIPEWCLSSATWCHMFTHLDSKQLCNVTTRNCCVPSIVFLPHAFLLHGPMLSVTQCPANVGCNTSWVIFFHFHKLAMAVNRTPMAAVRSYCNRKQSCRRLDCSSFLHKKTRVLGKGGWRRGANKNDQEEAMRSERGW